MENNIEKYIELFKNETGIQEVKSPKDEIIQKSGKATKSTLFGLLCISNIYIGNTTNFDSLLEAWTDKKYDGGIDFIFFDYDSRIVYIGQTKYTKIKNAESLRLIDNIIYSVDSIRKKDNTSIDGNKIHADNISKINNALEMQFNLEYVVVAKELVNDEKNLKKEIEKRNNEQNDYKISVIYGKDLRNLIIKSKIEVKPIKNWKINYDGRNCLRLISSDLDGYVINLSAWDLIQLYIKEQGNLFKYNVRDFISKNSGVSGIVNKGLKETVQETPEWFWFANNGIIIIAENVVFNLTYIQIKDFSIINGAQTISQLHRIYLESNENKNFKNIIIVAKIIQNFNQNERINNLIIKASNTQKPVSPWTFFFIW